MLKKFFVGALIALSSLGVVAVSEADAEDYQANNLCCGNYYARGNSQNYDDCCYDGGYCCR